MTGSKCDFSFISGRNVRQVIFLTSIPPHSGAIPLDEVPGMGIVLPGGLNMYYIDMAPNNDGTMVGALL